MRKDAFYFKHDCNARNDEKLLAVRKFLGMEGYGIYWAILEKMREEHDFMLTTDFDLVSWELHTDADKVKAVASDFGLFKFTDDGTRFYSERLVQDMQEWNEIKAKRSAAGKASAQSRAKAKVEENDTNAKQSCNTTATQLNTTATSVEQREENRKEEIIKDKIEKESIEKKDGETSSPAPSNSKLPVKRFVKPTIEEVAAYCSERNNGINPAHFIDFYESKGWKIGQNPMKDWKAAIRTWEQRDNNHGKTRTTTIADASQFTERL